MEAEIEKSEDKIDEIENRVTAAGMGRKEKRKLLKKLKRKQLRKEIAIKEKEIEEAASNDPKLQARLLQLEREEAERMEQDRIEFEERERQFVLDLERKKRELEEEVRKQDEDEANRGLVVDGNEDELNEGDDWEYVEEGPAEIIWKGNEIIVKKKKVKVPKKVLDLQKEKQESERPISNPLAPQSDAFNDYKSAQEVLECVAQEVPNFGTEKDKAHCPFHLKTGVCRFGVRCSRAHFYPDKSSTLLFKNMYNGPGLAWEQDEGLEHTEEEVERCFEEFYEDVHTEFMKFGEIINFKVCKNASSHLRGNVYVHYKFLESAVLAYQSTNGRYFAGKQLSCEFVNLTKWKVAICGEYMKSRLKACSRGSACNFIHCFRNPGGDYEWADWDKPAPRYWLKEMGALFGHIGYRSPDGSLRYHSKRSRSRDPDSCHRENHSDDDDDHRIRYLQRHRGHSEEKISPLENHRTKQRKTNSIGKRDCRSEEHKSGHGNSDSKCDRDLKSTSPVRLQREHRAKKSNESKKRERSDRSHEISGRYSSRKKSKFDSVHEYHYRNEKFNDMKKSPPPDRHLSKCCGHENEDSWQKKKEAFSPGIDFLEDTLQRDKNMRHSYKSLCMKDEANISTSNSLSEYLEYKSKSDSMERDQDKYQHRSANRSKAMKNIFKSVLDGGRTEMDEKRPEKNSGESIRSKNQEDFSDSRSERLQGRANRKRHSTKNRKHEAESSDNSSDGGTSQRYEKKSKKKRKTKSRSKSDSNVLDAQGSLISSNKKEGDDGFGDRNTVLYVECGSSCKSPGDSNGLEGKELADGEKRTCIDIKHVSTMNISNGATCSRATNCQNFDGEAEDDLEQTYRTAALKKLEEMRKCKATVSVYSHESIGVGNAESSKDVEEISPTREAKIGSASVRRKRI